MLLFSTILDVSASLTKDAFIKLVIEWNQGSPHAGNIVPGVVWNGERNIRFGTDRLWLDIEEYRNQNIIAVRYERREEDGVIWDTDYVMDFTARRMAVRLDRSYTSEASGTDETFATPHFITLLTDRGYLADDHGLPVLRTAMEMTEDNLGLLADLINGKTHYRLPVVYISKTGYDENPVSVAHLASRLKGAAHVLVEGECRISQKLRGLCDDRNEYNGAIGIYYPAKTLQHRRYLYRSTAGYDHFLLEKVVHAVIQYSNSQMTDTLLTWQGVNNALLRDRLASQREERLAAERAQREAEAQATRLIDTLDEEERRIRRQALEDARAEANALLESFDEEMQTLQKQIEDLTHANEALQFENQGLKTRLDSMDSAPVLCMGDEFDFYPGEIKDLLLATLSESLKNTYPKSRRADVIRDIIQNNDYQKQSVRKAEEVKRLLKNYDGMSTRTKQAFRELGFEITEEGKHCKVTYYGDSRYQTTYSKTPGDGRTGKNSAQETIKMAF